MCNQNNNSKVMKGTEIRFWGSKKVAKKIQWYRSLFTGDCSGEKSPTYINGRKNFEQMSQYMPSVKLILCVRNPVDRCYSNFQMGGRRKKNATFTDPSGTRNADKSRYFHLLNNNVLPYYSKDQIHICVAEWMRKDSNKELQKIYSFLDLPDYELPNTDMKANRAHKKGVRLADVKHPKIYKSWKNKYGEMSPELRQHLLKVFEKDNHDLFEFLGYDIPEWHK
jgi:hypothetical protein